MNKRGQGLSVNAIVLIVLGVLILVFLIIGFTMGWNKILPWIKPSNNVKDVADACKLACSTGSVYNFCTKKMEVRLDKEIADELGLSTPEIKDTCENLAANYPELGIESCPTITCPSTEAEEGEEGGEAGVEEGGE